MVSGCVDLSMQMHIQGWASQDGQPAAANIFVNETQVGRVLPTIDRPDVATHGHALRSGWQFEYAAPLDVDDVVMVRGDDGSALTFAPNADHAVRIRALTRGLDRTMPGLELGALDRPLLGKNFWNVTYVDHASRADLIAKYGGDRSGQLVADKIVETNIVWSAGSLAQAVADGRTFEFAVASHVIEHVPDMVTWLNEIGSVLVDGGLINLAIPDRDRTFDAHRRTTSVAEIIDDYVRRLTKPSARQIFDHVCNVVPVGSPRHAEPALAWNAVRDAAASGAYVDVHARVFTGESFAECMVDLTTIGLLPFSLDAYCPTQPGANEFIVSMRKRTTWSARDIAATWIAVSDTAEGGRPG